MSERGRSATLACLTSTWEAKITSMQVAVRLESVTKRFGQGDRELTVLDGASLSVRTGELVVVLGRSGTGKSTLLDLVAGIELPDAGTVEVAGIPISGLSDTDRTRFRRERVGFVFQFFNLIPTLTVEENVLLPLELRGGRLRPEEARHARQMLEEVGLAGRCLDYPDRLSGGEQQRVAIARALAHRPELVLADEPTGNLDLETGRQVVDLLDRLTRQEGKTLLMATHSREVAAVADRIVTVREGAIEEGAE
jgi:putative ABC transport system ATP-binding protein